MTSIRTIVGLGNDRGGLKGKFQEAIFLADRHFCC